MQAIKIIDLGNHKRVMYLYASCTGIQHKVISTGNYCVNEMHNVASLTVTTMMPGGGKN